ncbi:MAG: AAA family ATPase [Bacteroidota bacterium]
MRNLIKKLKIENFKSIKEVEITCGRVNIFVGKPNVGKSNILEALSLYTLLNSSFVPNEIIRFDTVDNFFHYKLLGNSIVIDSEMGRLELKYFDEQEKFAMVYGNSTRNQFTLSNYSSLDKLIEQIESKRGNDNFPGWIGTLNNYAAKDIRYKEEHLVLPSIKKYDFHKEKSVENFITKNHALLSPHGRNLPSILESNGELQDEISDFFKDYDLEFVLDRFDKKIEIQRRKENFVDKIPYHLTADTLQRIIFHYAAIASNKNSVLLFEEPEHHSFPPYIRALAEKIVESSANQFFITTHSPYLFNTLVSEINEPEGLAVFITTFKDYETKIKKLAEKELSKILNYGVDVFFNLEHFQNECFSK